MVVAAAVSLTDPSAYFAGQRRRLALFGGILLVALAAATVSVAASQRALRRQQELNAQRSNFVSSVSHELRAPLGSIRLLTESLESGRVSDDVRRVEYFRLIGQETRRLGALVENVLDFSRIEQGRKRYEFEPTDVLALVSGTAKLFEPLAAAREVRLDVQVPPAGTIGEPVTDGRALQQALLNLLDNALKHSPAGATIRLVIEGPEAAAERLANRESRIANGKGTGGTCPEPPLTPSPSPVGRERVARASLEPGEGHPSGRFTDSTRDKSLTTNISHEPPLAPRWFRLRVEDEGPGIPAADHARIFEPFFRRGSELRRETPGVGIGLSLVQHIAEAHGGRVEIDSAPGRGARFTLVLPYRENPSA